MSDKQSVLQAVNTLPEDATWTEITDALLGLVARQGTAADYARLYRTQITAADLSEYVNPAMEVSLESVLAELDSSAAARESA